MYGSMYKDIYEKPQVTLIYNVRPRGILIISIRIADVSCCVPIARYTWKLFQTTNPRDKRFWFTTSSFGFRSFIIDRSFMFTSMPDKFEIYLRPQTDEKLKTACERRASVK